MKETEIINCSPLLFFIGFYITDFICMSKFENILKQDWRGYIALLGEEICHL